MGKLLDELGGPGFNRGRIFSVTELPDGTFLLREENEGHFTATLTAVELRELGEELIALAEQQLFRRRA